jgi:microcystin-dependent protein
MGSCLPFPANTAVFLLGTTYGGNVTFGLLI